MKKIVIIISAYLFFTACSSNNEDKNKTDDKKIAATHYQLATVEKGGVATVIKLPAQLSAYEQVSIFPKVNGYVKTVLVDIGSKVSKGNLLMTLEAPELEQASLQAKERYARSKADYSIDKEHYMRLLEASETAGAISPLDLSTIKSKMEADSSLSNAEKNNWQMQQTMQGYLKVTAPFDGVITERNVHPGALVSAEAKDAKPMLELKQITHLRLEVDVPESIAGSLKNNDSVFFYTSEFPGKKMVALISRKSMNINPQFRSERIETDVMNKNYLLSPGMYADVVFNSGGNINAFIVPTSSVVTSTESKYVIVVRNDKAVKVPVSTGNNTTEKTEVFGKLEAGEKVIINASDEIKEGIIINKLS